MMRDKAGSSMWFARRTLFLLALALTGTGCLWAVPTKTDPAFEPSLSVSPRPETEAGGFVKITVNSKRPPSGLLYRWRATPGQCDPQESFDNQTTYKAPSELLGDNAVSVPVTVEFILDGKNIGHKTVSITLKPGTATVEQATPPPPVSPTVEAKPTIQITITEVPPYSFGGPDELYPISGKVSGTLSRAALSEYQVVLYALTDTWYVQPFTGGLSFTAIDAHGNFSNQTHGGASYAALLVKKSFTNPPAKTIRLPEVGEVVVAVSVVQGRK